MRKKIVILVPHGHQLANQLWNFISIYAYCLEKGYACENPSFFRYHRFFDFPQKTVIRTLLSFLNRMPWQRVRGFSYALHEKYIAWLRMNRKPQIVANKREPYVFYLPPSETVVPEYQEALSRIERSEYNTFYFDGWLFRNPIGIEKYRNRIKECFRPKEHTVQKVNAFLAPLRKQGKRIVGVHIRQTDYATYMEGRFFFTQKEVREILDSYLQHAGKSASDVIFVICSDATVDAAVFAGLTVAMPGGDAAGDLLTLASCDMILGSDSTYGAFASYYGNIPFIVFDKNGVPWKEHADKKAYFENHKCINVFY